MTRLFAMVRTPAEVEQVARAGFDGTMSDDPALAGGGLAALRRAEAGGPAHVVLADAQGRRILHRFDGAVPDGAALDSVVQAGAAGILLAAQDRLLDEVGIAEVGVLRALCGARGLFYALAGGLESPDAPRLLTYAPDLLVFGRALRGEDGMLDQRALALLRDLVPPEGGEPAAVAQRAAPRRAPDLIFLRDLVLPIAIGAYASERDRKQRVRFSVEAEVRETGRPTRDMRDVVSYDLFADAITALTSDRHVEFVETLAEEIAAAVLVHPRISRVRVTVEKLDIGPGAVGVTIERRDDE
jgi:dihydroneopterin aldolase